MSDYPSLFGDDEPRVTAPIAQEATGVATWQIDMIRSALDARGLSAMAERQRFVETNVGRELQSLRALTGDEAMALLSRLGQSATRRRTDTGSAWDDRGEDTWIDRL